MEVSDGSFPVPLAELIHFAASLFPHFLRTDRGWVAHMVLGLSALDCGSAPPLLGRLGEVAGPVIMPIDTVTEFAVGGGALRTQTSSCHCSPGHLRAMQWLSQGHRV